MTEILKLIHKVDLLKCVIPDYDHKKLYVDDAIKYMKEHPNDD